MKVTPISNNLYSFGTNTRQNSKTNNQNKNPISKSGEKANLVYATFIAGLGIGARLLCELMDGDFVVEKLSDSAENIVNKQHQNVSQNKKLLLHLGAFAGLIAMFIGGFALLYTLFKAPNINYNGNVNAFKKKKEMDVYIKGNKIEKDLYTQMNEKAKNANSEEKEKLRQQYLQMQMAKNKLPNFVKV